MPRLATFTLLLLVGLASLAAPAWAAMDRDEAAALAHRLVPGRVLAVEHGVHVDNSIVWRVKVLTPSGEIRQLVIDAQTGRSR